MNKKFCILEDDKICTNCGECMMCDLDENKVCNNCGKCLNEMGSDYAKIIIDEIIMDK